MNLDLLDVVLHLGQCGRLLPPNIASLIQTLRRAKLSSACFWLSWAFISTSLANARLYRNDSLMSFQLGATKASPQRASTCTASRVLVHGA